MWFRKLSIFKDSQQDQQWSNLVRFFVNPRFGTDTDYAEFELDGTFKATGAATAWNDINFSAGNLKPGGTAPTWSSIVGGLYGYVFGASTVDELHGCEEILHDYKEGSDITPHIHWSPLTTNTGNVRWGLEYSWVNRSAVGTATTTIYVEQAATGVVGTHQVISLPTISGTGKEMGSYFCCRIFRDGTHVNDTFTGGAFMPQFGIHYEKDTLGSRSVTTK